MATFRRLLFATGILLIILLFAAGANLPGSLTARAVTPEVFEAAKPPKLYAGDTSHVGLARADPGLGLNGYCVKITADNRTAYGGINPIGSGFTITNGVIVDTDAFDNDGTATTTDDVHCAVVQAGVGVTSLTLSFTYTDVPAPTTITLTIPVVTVTLSATNGFVGGRALICTVGWDPTFLTGRTSNTPLTLPDALDDVATTDFVASVGTLLTPYKDTLTGQWCVGLTNGAPQTDISVTFNFDAVYDLTTNADDTQHSASTTVDIAAEPQYSILRHVTPGGQLLESQGAPLNVTGAMHYACIIPSSAGDTINLADIHIVNTGGPDVANVGGLVAFHNSTEFPGVAAGTLCIGWTSTSPGEQNVNLTFTKAPNQTRSVGWATTDNGSGGIASSPLLKTWNRIDSTRITSGGDYTAGIVTGTTITTGIQFNVANGKFLGSVGLTEWVVGSHRTGATTVSGPLDGVVLKARITGSCGFFTGPGSDTYPGLGQLITGTSVGGRFDEDGDGTADDLGISISGDPGCSPGSVIHIAIDAYYPGATTPTGAPETVDINFTFQAGAKTPTVAWVSQTVTIEYGFSTGGGSCGDAGATVLFQRGKGQPGTFLPGGGVTVSGGSKATATLGSNCSTVVRYESEDPGEVDIEVSISTNPYAKMAYPIFFIAFEDLTTTASDKLIVSERGDVSATVRGWFVGTNPSGRAAETKPDGRTVPANRWVIPTDWQQLRGPGDFRQNWPDTPDFPLTNVTFFMENEQIVNNYRSGVKNGASGWFLLDGSESNLNVNPKTGLSSALGSVDRPRILTDLLDSSGVATVDSFGDFNLTYEGCPANKLNGNPHCRVDDVVGHTRYFAVAEYPSSMVKYPAIISNVAQTDWTWGGYKEVTIIDGESPSTKYVVAHLKDRDGYCDARSLNNTLGVLVDFQIDAGDGIILEAQGAPSSIVPSKRAAVATTYDTKDEAGILIHTDIAKTVVAEDECQAWIKVSNSLLTDTNVLVTFPVPPSPLPGNLRITGLICTGNESVTLTNVGPNPVSLEGFSLQSSPDDPIADPEYLALYDYLKPGESRTFAGGPGASGLGWLEAGEQVFRNDDPTDYARLVWNGFAVSQWNCDGKQSHLPFPASFPLDPEGEIQVDITIPFGSQLPVPLTTGWNLVSVPHGGMSVASVVAGHEAQVAGIYTWDGRAWKRYLTGAPRFLNTLEQFETGQVYWVQVKQPFTLTLLK